MKSLSIILCAALLAVSASGQGEPRGRSPEIPAPPAPPMPPMPPILLAPPPPPPPAPPAVPERAHAACIGKQIGTAMSLSPVEGATMRGTCQRDSKGMYFELQSTSSQL